jgi:hypothetical protein
MNLNRAACFMLLVAGATGAAHEAGGAEILRYRNPIAGGLTPRGFVTARFFAPAPSTGYLHLKPGIS